MSEEKSFSWNEHTFYTNAGSKTPKNRIIVSLSDGKTLFEDDTFGEKHFWRRLQEYIHQTDIKITKVRYQVGKYMIEVPDHADYYFFIKRQYGDLQSSQPLSESIKLGYSNDGEVVVGSEYGMDGTSHFEQPIEKCGAGLIDNR